MYRQESRVYTWNDEKNRENKRKHGFYLSEITDVFDDPHLFELYDSAHFSVDDERYICIGCLRDTAILYVVTADTQQNNTQIISARRVTPKEENAYYEHYRQETGGN
jgi:uncharacterized DUF497 family protein